MESIKFSIVIPIYNRVDTLDKCIQNVLFQDYSNYELILINDASCDGTDEICNKYSQKYDNVIAIHNKRNLGPGLTRNEGLKKATGDYILFLDSDDEYDNDLLSKVYSGIIGDDENNPRNPDIVVYSLWEEYYNTKGDLIHKFSHSIPSRYITDADDIHHTIVLLEEETMLGYPWNKAYNLNYIRKAGASFTDVEHIEDILFNIEAFEYIESLLVLEDKLYHYRNVSNNRLTEKYLVNYFDLQCKRIWEFYEQQKRWGTLDEYALCVLAKEYFRWLLSAAERQLNEGIPRNEVRTFLAKEYNSMLYAILHKHLNVGPKLKALYKPMLERNTKKTVSLAKKISTIKRKTPQLFSLLKQN